MIVVSIGYIQLLAVTQLSIGQHTFLAYLNNAIIYGCFNRLYHDSPTASVASLVLLVKPDFLSLLITSFVIDRAFILSRKSTYIAVSFLTAMKNKKQRFSRQWICFLL